MGAWFLWTRLDWTQGISDDSFRLRTMNTHRSDSSAVSHSLTGFNNKAARQGGGCAAGEFSPHQTSNNRAVTALHREAKGRTQGTIGERDERLNEKRENPGMPAHRSGPDLLKRDQPDQRISVGTAGTHRQGDVKQTLTGGCLSRRFACLFHVLPLGQPDKADRQTGLGHVRQRAFRRSAKQPKSPKRLSSTRVGE